MSKWKPGEQSELARRAGVSKQQLSNILARRSRPSVKAALRLERAAQEMGLRIPKEDWLFSKETGNIYFREIV